MSRRAIEFIHELRFDDLPPPVVAQATRCLVDLVGVAAAGTTTPLSRIVRGFVVEQMGGTGETAALVFDGRRVSRAGAALANGMTIDAIDAHDGHVLTKGHSGAAILPALLAGSDGTPGLTGPSFLCALVVGYEIAIRAGIVLHATAPDYHTSGAWNALGAAAVCARLLALSTEETRHALGIAEFHGPRSQMMRCIEHPVMLKDGSGWGAMAGVSAAHLARAGFTGAPAVTVEDAAGVEAWADLGTRWRTTEQYFKPYPVCRWAQPAVEAVLALKRAHDIAAEDVDRVDVLSFHQAARLCSRAPATTEEAQYSLAFPVAVALVRGMIGADDVAGSGLGDAAILSLAARVDVRESEALNALFPKERWARAAVRLRDGRVLESPPTTDRGNADSSLTDAELERKFRDLAEPVLGADESSRLLRLAQSLSAGAAPVAELLSALAARPPAAGPSDAATAGSGAA